MNRPTNQRAPERAPADRAGFGKLMAAIAPFLALLGKAVDALVGDDSVQAYNRKRKGSLSGSQKRVRRMLRRMDPKHRKKAMRTLGRSR